MYKRQVVGGGHRRRDGAEQGATGDRPAAHLARRDLRQVALDRQDLFALLVEAETQAAEEIADRWYVDPAGRALLAATGDGGESGDGESDEHGALEASQLLREWQTWLREQARRAAPATRTRTRGTTTASLVMLATVAAVAPHAGQVTAPGTTSQALRRVLAEPAVSRLGTPARVELVRAVSEHFAARSRRWLRRVEERDVDPELARRLRQAAADVSVARQLALVLGRAA